MPKAHKVEASRLGTITSEDNASELVMDQEDVALSTMAQDADDADVAQELASMRNVAQKLAVMSTSMGELLGINRLQMTGMATMQVEMKRMREEIKGLRAEVKVLSEKSDIDHIFGIESKSKPDGPKSPVNGRGPRKTRKKGIKKKTWGERICDIEAFKQEHGHVDVSKVVDLSLAQFCSNVRHSRRHPERAGFVKLDDERIASLDEIGFDWNPMKLNSDPDDENETEEGEGLTPLSGRKRKRGKYQTFEDRLKDLALYKEKHGHTNVMANQDHSLYHFCVNARYARKNEGRASMKLSDARVTALDTLGFDWGHKTIAFSERLENLKVYKETNPGRRSVATAGLGTRDVEAGPNVQVGGAGGNGELAGEPPRRLTATLSSRPKTLQDLWHEYQFGMSGKKPARKFSDSERGKVKSVYSFRLKFWEKCDEMVRSGMTADAACDRIYQAYGVGTSVTKILTAMKRDKRLGSWPASLQVLHA